MGMAASQARYLALRARQSNLEYQGQQINQERSVLSQQVTALYEQLNTLNVPTPPSTNDFTSVQYSGKLGTTTYSFNAGDVKPGKDGGYNVTLGYTDYGNSLSRNNGYATTSTGYETIEKGVKFNSADTQRTEDTKLVSGYSVLTSGDDESPANGETFFIKQGTKPNAGTTYWVMNEEGTHLVPGNSGNKDNEENEEYYYIPCNDPSKWDPANCIKVNQTKENINVTIDKEPKVKLKSDDLNKLYIIDDNGVITKANAGEHYTVDSDGTINLMPGNNFFLDNGQGSDEAKKGSTGGKKIAGYSAMTMADFKATFDEKSIDTYNGYVEAINNSGLKDSSGKAYKEDDFLVYIDDNGKPHFALASDVNDNDTCVTYDYLSNGSYTKNEPFEDAKLQFDPATGRITSIDIPSKEKDADGKPLSWTTVTIEAKTVTDELAYQDAYNDYEYEKYLYDKKNQEINAKTEIIQQQDKNLELKLTRLDNERKQCDTELEAVKKVLEDNIDKTYKTFSG